MIVVGSWAKHFQQIELLRRGNIYLISNVVICQPERIVFLNSLEECCLVASGSLQVWSLLTLSQHSILVETCWNAVEVVLKFCFVHIEIGEKTQGPSKWILPSDWTSGWFGEDSYVVVPTVAGWADTSWSGSVLACPNASTPPKCALLSAQTCKTPHIKRWSEW